MFAVSIAYTDENKQLLIIAKRFERVRGIEPPSRPWEGRILPLYYTREFEVGEG